MVVRLPRAATGCELGLVSIGIGLSSGLRPVIRSTSEMWCYAPI